MLNAVLRLCIQRFTDARVALGGKHVVQGLECVSEDFENRATGHQYWSNYKGLASAIVSMKEDGKCERGPLRLECAGEYAALLRAPNDQQEASLSKFIDFLKVVDETKHALESAQAMHGKQALKLVAKLSHAIVKACAPWLEAVECSNIGTCFKAVQHRFEESYASTNLDNACKFVQQIMLNNSTVAPVIDRSHHNQALVC